MCIGIDTIKLCMRLHQEVLRLFLKKKYTLTLYKFDHYPIQNSSPAYAVGPAPLPCFKEHVEVLFLKEIQNHLRFHLDFMYRVAVVPFQLKFHFGEQGEATGV